jgi:hypothetical protein
MIRKGFFKASINLKCSKCGKRGDLITNKPRDLLLALNSWRWTLVDQPICEACAPVPRTIPTIRQHIEMPPPFVKRPTLAQVEKGTRQP